MSNLPPRHDSTAFLAESLLAHCLSAQSRKAEAISRLEKRIKKQPSSDLRLLLCKLYVEQDQWTKAEEMLIQTADDLTPDTPLARQAASLLLSTAAHYSKEGTSSHVFTCLAAALHLFPESPQLKELTPNLAENRPALLFLSGDYPSAAEEWETQLKRDGYRAELVHALAIAHQCRLESAEPFNPERRLQALEKGYMFWIALSQDADYWQGRFNKRSQLYGSAITKEHFLDTVYEMGVSRCHTRLPMLREEWEKEGNRDALERLNRVQSGMALERHTGNLLSEVRKSQRTDWPPGGFGLLAFLWGPKELKESISRMGDYGVGSASWLIKGLIRDMHQDLFIRFLNQDYDGFLQQVQHPSDPMLANLKGLAYIRKAETAIETQMYEGCPEMASAVSEIPDEATRQKADQLLEEMVGHRVKQMLGQARTDEGIEFLKDILTRANAESGSRLGKIRNQLASLLLKRGESRYVAKDLDGFVNDFEAANRFANDPSMCQDKLKLVAWDCLGGKLQKGSVKAAKAFIDRMNRTFPSPFLRAMTKVSEALVLLEEGRTIGNKSVLNLLQEAFKFYGDDNQIKELLSSSLTGSAIEEINGFMASLKQIQSGGPIPPQAIVDFFDTTILKLQQALMLNPANQQARDNLAEVMKLKDMISSKF